MLFDGLRELSLVILLLLLQLLLYGCLEPLLRRRPGKIDFVVSALLRLRLARGLLLSRLLRHLAHPEKTLLVVALVILGLGPQLAEPLLREVRRQLRIVTRGNKVKKAAKCEMMGYPRSALPLLHGQLLLLPAGAIVEPGEGLVTLRPRLLVVIPVQRAKLGALLV